jgi:hypothetical protein
MRKLAALRDDLVRDLIGRLAEHVHRDVPLRLERRVNHALLHRERDPGLELLSILLVPLQNRRRLGVGQRTERGVAAQHGNDCIRGRGVLETTRTDAAVACAPMRVRDSGHGAT